MPPRSPPDDPFVAEKDPVFLLCSYPRDRGPSDSSPLSLLTSRHNDRFTLTEPDASVGTYEMLRLGALCHDHHDYFLSDLDFFYSICSPPGPGALPICLALSISSHSSRFDAIPAAEAMQLRSTRNESYTPSCVGSIGSPVVRLRPTMLPSACSS
jgi:hypothetical protein